KKLDENPKELEVLGDGNQVKSYLHVFDCVGGMLFAIEHSSDEINLFNLGSDDQITVKEITDIVIQELAPNAKARYTGGDRGWKGDVPKMFLDNSKIKSLGWKPKYNSKDAVLESVKSLK
ncbi:UDP-glucose 4-epimerase, partial [archaeon]|nr:UDP-glucose 4-epimerase [archaeon]